MSEILPKQKGISRLCVPFAGTYKISVQGCHKFADPTSVLWNTKEPSRVITFNAIGHTISGYVESTRQIADLIIHIEKGNNESLVEL